MAIFRTRPSLIEAITFDELVQVGIQAGVPLHNGMPWSFSFHGFPITHENDNCYLVGTTSVNVGFRRFERGQMLLIHPDNELEPMFIDVFNEKYEPYDAIEIHSDLQNGPVGFVRPDPRPTPAPPSVM